MKLQSKIITYFIAILFGLFSLPFFAFAQTIDVVFETEPLFSEIDLLPGDSVTRFVDVSNLTEIEKNIRTEAKNEVGCGIGVCMADRLQLEITEGDTTYFSGTLTDFFDAGEVPLGTLSANSTARYDYSVMFLEDTGDTYQEASVGFDLLVGFVGEAGTTDNASSGGGSGGGSILLASTGGGGGNGPISTTEGLAISNIRVVDIDKSGTATITWDTNYLATSQVVYGLASEGPYSINLTLPNFGYPFATQDDLAKVLNHSVVITGLIPGETYSYRTVSHASPPTVSYEYAFTIPDGSIVSTGTETGNSAVGVSGLSQSIAGQTEVRDSLTQLGVQDNKQISDNGGYVYINTGDDEATSLAIVRNSNDSLKNNNGNVGDANIASVFSAGQSSQFTWWGIILAVLIAVYLIWRTRKRYNF